MAVLHYTKNGHGKEYRLTDSQNLFGGSTTIPGIVTLGEAQRIVEDKDMKDLGIKEEVRTAYGPDLISLIGGRDRELARAAMQFMAVFEIPIEKYRVHDTVRQELVGIFSGWEDPQRSLNHRVRKKLEELGLECQVAQGTRGMDYLQIKYGEETVNIRNNPGTFRAEVNKVISMIERVENQRMGISS